MASASYLLLLIIAKLSELITPATMRMMNKYLAIRVETERLVCTGNSSGNLEKCGEFFISF